MLQQDNEPKHTSKLVLEWIKKANFKLLEWPHQNSTSTVLEICGLGLKAGNSTNFAKSGQLSCQNHTDLQLLNGNQNKYYWECMYVYI